MIQQTGARKRSQSCVGAFKDLSWSMSCIIRAIRRLQVMLVVRLVILH